MLQLILGTAKQESLPRIANGTINPGYRDVDWVFSKHTGKLLVHYDLIDVVIVHQRPQQPRGQVMSTFCSPDREVEDDDITDRSVFTDNIYEDMNSYKTH